MPSNVRFGIPSTLAAASAVNPPLARQAFTSWASFSFSFTPRLPYSRALYCAYSVYAMSVALSSLPISLASLQQFLQTAVFVRQRGESDVESDTIPDGAAVDAFGLRHAPIGNHFVKKRRSDTNITGCFLTRKASWGIRDCVTLHGRCLISDTLGVVGVEAQSLMLITASQRRDRAHLNKRIPLSGSGLTRSVRRKLVATCEPDESRQESVSKRTRGPSPWTAIAQARIRWNDPQQRALAVARERGMNRPRCGSPIRQRPSSIASNTATRLDSTSPSRRFAIVCGLSERQSMSSGTLLESIVYRMSSGLTSRPPYDAKVAAEYWRFGPGPIASSRT